MNAAIYNPNSSGGNYEYILRLTQSLNEAGKVQVVLLLPGNAPASVSSAIQKVLLPDKLNSRNGLINKIYFVWRSLINPLVFFFFIVRKKPQRIIFNDYDQLTAFFWIPLFLLIKGSTRKFSLILHDPDRDGYFRIKKLSEISMRVIMRLMDVAFYHEILPEKKYYKKGVNYVSIPHGIYERKSPEINDDLLGKIRQFKDGNVLYGIIGNIRLEKNYELIIKALSENQGKLLIAGSRANSSVDVGKLKDLASALGIADRIYWLEKYLTEEELHTSIVACDVMLLYYKKTFHSQSGIVNIIAPYRKKLVVADTPSALAITVRKFGLGELVKADDLDSISSAMKDQESVLINMEGWDNYLNYASWDNAALIIKKEFLHEA